MASQRLAVVLLNLGGPLKQEDIRPFLFNFFRDKNIITLPNPFRWGLAWWIAKTRSQGAAKSAYAALGGRSPLLQNTEAQAAVLELALQRTHPATRVFISMRYWHPQAAATLKGIIAHRPDKVILLPLYPQYSTTTTFSSLQNWAEEARAAGLDAPVNTVCCYPDDAAFIAAGAALIKESLEKAPEKVRVLFSAHGLPEKIIAAGDPYQSHCEKTAAALVGALGVPGLDWSLCYQSRVGRLKWIGPSLEEELARAAKDKVGVVIYPLAFVSEHVETLVELDEELRHKAETLGVPGYQRVPTVSTHPVFIDGLAKLVLSSVEGTPRPRACASACPKCFYKVKNDGIFATPLYLG